MSNEEIRFSYGDAKVYLKDNGKFKYENDKDKTLQNSLKNIFDAIAKADTKGNKQKVDGDYEKTLLQMLKSIFNADGDESISDEELAWAKGYDGGDIAQFLREKQEKIDEAKLAEEQRILDEKRQAEQARLEAEAEQARLEAEAEQARLEAEAEQARVDAENAKIAAEEKKKADRAAFDKSINKLQGELSTDGVTSVDYTIKKGDSFWKIAKEQLIAEGNAKPRNQQIMERIALIAKLNGIDSVSGYKLYANNKIFVPGDISVTPPGGGAPEPKPVVNVPTIALTDSLDDADMEELTGTDAGITKYTRNDNRQVFYGANPSCDGMFNVIAPTIAELRDKTAQVEAEHARLTTPPGGESEADAAVRKQTNLEAITNIMELCSYDKGTISTLISNYITPAGMVDLESDACKALIQGLRNTGDDDILALLDLLTA